ncbi:RNA-directed DNA polymerase, eukaryota [Tanacetum coccineum]
MGSRFQNSLQSNFDQTAKISKSVFISNFPDDCSSRDLWKFSVLIVVFENLKELFGLGRFPLIRNRLVSEKAHSPYPSESDVGASGIASVLMQPIASIKVVVVSQLCNAKMICGSKERIVWVDIEGVPLNAWSLGKENSSTCQSIVIGSERFNGGSRYSRRVFISLLGAASYSLFALGRFLLEVLDGMIKGRSAIGFFMDGCLTRYGEDYWFGREIVGFPMNCLSFNIQGGMERFLVYGDYNEVRFERERMGSVFNVHGANEFNSFISNAGLVEIQLEGYSFTWSHPSAVKMTYGQGCLEFICLEDSNGLWCGSKRIANGEKENYQGGVSDEIFLSPDGVDDETNAKISMSTACCAKCGRLRFSGAKNSVLLANRVPRHGRESVVGLNFRFPSAHCDNFTDLEKMGPLMKFAKRFRDEKILAIRLSSVISDLISDVQTAFLPNRQILDGPFIINELLSWCRHKKQQAMVFKVDFAKAYDSVRWDYLDDVLFSFGFGVKWRSWIKGSLISGMASVLVNGSPTSEFQFHCGLKQGDPLAPYLFILVMESLHLSVSRTVEAGIFTGIKIDSALSISHLFYADDAVFIGEWTDSNLRSIIQMLHCFSLASGLKINLQKSNLLGVGVTGSLVNEAAASIGCSVMKAPFKYLGVMVGGNMSKINA